MRTPAMSSVPGVVTSSVDVDDHVALTVRVFEDMIIAHIARAVGVEPDRLLVLVQRHASSSPLLVPSDGIVAVAQLVQAVLDRKCRLRINVNPELARACAWWLCRCRVHCLGGVAIA